MEIERVLLPYYSDRIDERSELAREAEAVYVQASSTTVNLQARLAHAPLMLLEGDWDAVRQTFEVTPTGFEPVSIRLRASIASRQGEQEYAWRLVREALPDGPRTEPGDGDFLMCTWLQRVAAEMALDAGDLPLADEWLQAHDRWLAPSGVILGLSEGHTLWAQYYRAAGDPKRAREYAEQALRRAAEPRQPLALLAARRLLGELATEHSQFTDAEEHLAASLALADACAAPYERALTLLATAELRVATSDMETARALLDEVRAICTPLNARLALTRADQIDARLAAARQRTPTHPAGLSAREVDVLRLIAAGKTNREIADALFLSPATVNIHVTHILTKTNTANRAEAATFALRHGLA
jgi:DNA-binding CsgD family transcriptional regulator